MNILLFTVVMVQVALGADPATPNYGRYNNAVHCSREPPPGMVVGRKTPGDSGFKIKISGNPERYTPGEVYTGN